MQPDIKRKAPPARAHDHVLLLLKSEQDLALIELGPCVEAFLQLKLISLSYCVYSLYITVLMSCTCVVLVQQVHTK